jgi:hypothetical protein
VLCIRDSGTPVHGPPDEWAVVEAGRIWDEVLNQELDRLGQARRYGPTRALLR